MIVLQRAVVSVARSVHRAVTTRAVIVRCAGLIAPTAAREVRIAAPNVDRVHLIAASVRRAALMVRIAVNVQRVRSTDPRRHVRCVMMIEGRQPVRDQDRHAVEPRAEHRVLTTSVAPLVIDQCESVPKERSSGPSAVNA